MREPAHCLGGLQHEVADLLVKQRSDVLLADKEVEPRVSGDYADFPPVLEGFDVPPTKALQHSENGVIAAKCTNGVRPYREPRVVAPTQAALVDSIWLCVVGS